jgi:K(+)-stimulated pyrophosphate-energized sodium pump
MTPAAGALVVVFVAGTAALAAAGAFARQALAADPGTDEMQRIAAAIREGARAFVRRQYGTVAALAAVVAAGVFFLYFSTESVELAWKTALAFAFGATCSAGAGYWGMFVSLRANVRVASAARTSLGAALRLALRSGAAAALTISAASLLGVALLFVMLGGLTSPDAVPYEMVGFAFGASFVALFAQLGGGIYTKAADVGADMVGKVEAGIPEDDPRNPAVIADLVGDNVGDCAGRGADLFESTAAENIGAMVLGVALFGRFGAAGVVFPLAAAAAGLLASIVGVLTVRLARESERPMTAMTRGYVVTTLLSAVGLYAAVRYLLADSAWLVAAAMIGLVASFAFAAIARYYTSYRYRPARSIAESSVTGAATNVIGGLAVALGSTAVPVLTIGAAILGSYYCGVHALPGEPGAGVWGTAVATAGMLAPVGYVLSMDVFGPITDNAGGIVEMSGQPPDVRTRTDALDAAGNTTKALTKGYAIGSAALAAFLLLSAYMDRITRLGRAELRALGDPAWSSFRFEHVDIGSVPIFVAALLGAGVAFLFSAQAIRAVARDARAVVEEVRRQLREIPGIMDRTAKPDFARCVDIVTRGALEGMIAPGLLAVSAPIAVGLLFRWLGGPGSRMLGAEAVAAELLVGTITGVLLALLMNTGGGAWDNAKKLVETGALGGKQSEAHKAAIVGDAVGDPLKDTAGPSLHVLVKLLATVALVAAPLFIG